MTQTPNEEFKELYKLFPFTYKKIAEIIGTSENMVARKISPKEYTKYYKFTIEEVNKFKSYIIESAATLKNS